MSGAFALLRHATADYPLKQVTDLVAAFDATDLVLTFTPDGAAVEHDYRYLVASTNVWSPWVRLPDAEEAFSPNTGYVFQVRGVDINDEVGPTSNGSVATFTVQPHRTFIAPTTAGDYEKTNDASSHTFTTGVLPEPTGPTHLVCVFVNRAASAQLLTSVTVNGVAADIRQNGSAGLNTRGYFTIPITTGGAKTIVLTWAGTVVRSAIAPYVVTDLQSPAHLTLTQDSTMASGVLTATVASIPDFGVIIAMAMNAAAGVFGWVGLTEDFEVVPESLQFATASEEFASAQTNLAVTATASGQTTGTNPNLSIWVFR